MRCHSLVPGDATATPFGSPERWHESSGAGHRVLILLDAFFVPAGGKPRFPRKSEDRVRNFAQRFLLGVKFAVRATAVCAAAWAPVGRLVGALERPIPDRARG